MIQPSPRQRSATTPAAKPPKKMMCEAESLPPQSHRQFVVSLSCSLLLSPTGKGCHKDSSVIFLPVSTRESASYILGKHSLKITLSCQIRTSCPPAVEPELPPLLSLFLAPTTEPARNAPRLIHSCLSSISTRNRTSGALTQYCRLWIHFRENKKIDTFQ